MTTRSDGTGIAILCDAQGKILRVLDDGIGIMECAALPQSFAALMDPDCVSKAQTFLTKVQELGIVCNWELNLFVSDGDPLLFHFVGTWLDEGPLLVGVQRRADLGSYWQQQLRLVPTSAERAEIIQQMAITLEDQGHDQAIFNEITRLNNDLTTTQRKLIKNQRQLERLMQEKNDLMNMAAHDIRNPLSAIQMFSEVLLDNPSLSQEQEDLLKDIYESSTSTLNLVHSLLDIAQIEAGKLELHRIPTAVVGILEAQVRLQGVVARRKQIQIRLEVEPDLPDLPADGIRLQQVIENLLSNAIKFSPPETTVRVGVTQSADEMVIAVQDEGPGIPWGEQAQLFLPFGKVSVRPTAGEPSTGLGLAIAKKIVRAHGGRIWVESEVNQGTTFYAAFPLAPPT